MILLGALCFVLASFLTHTVTRVVQPPSVSYNFPQVQAHSKVLLCAQVATKSIQYYRHSMT